MTRDEACRLAAQHQGIKVRPHKRTWVFYATFHTTDRRRNRYAGKSIERALSLRAELIATYAKSDKYRLPVGAD